MPNEHDHPTHDERENFPASYEDVVRYRRKRQRRNAKNFPGLWECFMRLDRIWRRDLDRLMASISGMEDALPVFLFHAAHAKLHVVIDLGFSDYLVEAYSITRDAVEHVAHGCRLRAKPELTDTWLNFVHDEPGIEAWKREFWFDKKVRLFEDHPDLLQIWKACSDYGSHANSSSLVQGFCFDTISEITLRYNGVSPERTPELLFGLLIFFALSELRVFDLYTQRLTSDSRLRKMRHDFSNNMLSVAATLGVGSSKKDLSNLPGRGTSREDPPGLSPQASLGISRGMPPLQDVEGARSIAGQTE